MAVCTCESSLDDHARLQTRVVSKEERSCTDILFLLLFFISFVVVIAIYLECAENGGDPHRIIRGVDFQGRICGKDEGVKDKSWAAWPDYEELDFKICVSHCNETRDNEDFFLETYESVEFIYYCLPDVTTNINGSVSISLSGDFESASEEASRAIADIYTARVVIAVSLGIALIASFLFVYLSRCIVGPIVWVSILVTIVAGFFLGYTMLERAKEYGDSDMENRQKAMWGLGITVVVVTAVFTLLVIVMRNRIRIAIGVSEHGARALSDMKTLVFFPILPLIWGVAYVVFWIWVALYIFSVGTFESEPTPESIYQFINTTGDTVYPQNYSDFSWNEDLKRAFAYHFFHFLWATEFLIYFTYMSSAMACAYWYFTPYVNDEKPRGSNPGELSSSVVSTSAWTVFRFHTGSIACGSLIIAIVEFIRALVHYIEETCANKDNAIVKCVFCVCHCCLWCVECCLDKINKNAFIWMCVFGDSFFDSAINAFDLLWRNLARAAAVSMVGAYLMFIGKLFVALFTTAVCSYYLSNSTKFQEELSSTVMPLVVIFILAYMVASLVMSTFETTIDTTFFCFLIDEHCNRGGKMLAHPDLIAIVDKYQPESEKQAKNSQTMRTARGFDKSGGVAAASGGAATGNTASDQNQYA